MQVEYTRQVNMKYIYAKLYLFLATIWIREELEEITAALEIGPASSWIESVIAEQYIKK